MGEVGVCWILFAIVTLVSGADANYTLTCQQMDEIVSDLEQLIVSTFANDEDGNPYRLYIGGFVRLSFHMCTGGVCTGCINLNDPANFHLDIYVQALEDVYNRHPFIHRGDLWALAGITALRVSENITNQIFGASQTYMQQLLKFRYGRDDCPTAPLTTDAKPFPSPFLGLNDVRSFFFDNFRFNDEQMVAIMGAHRLGGLRNPVSNQIVNQWVTSPDLLDNRFYVNLVNSSNGWFQSGHVMCSFCNPIYFWTNRQDRRLMFNTDMSLYKGLRFARGNRAQSTCTYRTCKPSQTAQKVADFARSNDRWLKAFAPAFMKMIEIGYGAGSLQVPRGCK